MPTDFIHEDHVAVGSDLFFPNVQSCAAIIVMSDGGQLFGGYHITVGSTAQELTAACGHLTATLVGNISQVYVIGNVARQNVSGIGGGATLRDALRVGLNYAGAVRRWQASVEQMRGVAVRIQRNAAPPNAVELRIADPGQWALGGQVANNAGLRRVRRDGQIAAPPIATSLSAAFNGNQNIWALGGFDVM